MGYIRLTWHHQASLILNKVQIHRKKWVIWAEICAFLKTLARRMTGYA